MMPREMTPGDRRYVVPTWAYESRYDGMSKRQRFEHVDAILDAGARCIVLAEGPTVHAWACGGERVLHFVYVPHMLRGHGLGRRVVTELLGAYPDRIEVTHAWPYASERYQFTPSRKAA